VAKDVRNPLKEGSCSHGGETMLATVTEVHGNCLKVVAESDARHDQRDRIIEALGVLGEHLPNVDEETLSRYYNYLSARMSFPFTVHYPEPTTSLEEVQYRCTVQELLDPAEDILMILMAFFARPARGNTRSTCR
jgi:hypothetical protein